MTEAPSPRLLAWMGEQSALWGAPLTLYHGCTVMSVGDGDSLHVRSPVRKALFVVRLAQIDAPEIAHGGALHWPDQPFGRDAAAALKTLALGKACTMLLAKTKDKYGRTDAFLAIGSADVGTAQIRAGCAWAYDVPKGSKYPALQAAAKAAGLGLWALPNPVAPQAWRQGHR